VTLTWIGYSIVSAALTLLVACGAPGTTASVPDTELARGENDIQCDRCEDDENGAYFMLIEYAWNRVPELGEASSTSAQIVAMGLENGRVLWRTSSPQASTATFATAVVDSACVKQLALDLYQSLSAWDERSFFLPETGAYMCDVSDGGRSASVTVWPESVEQDLRAGLEAAVSAHGEESRDEVIARFPSQGGIDFREAWTSMREKVSVVIETASKNDPQPCVLEKKSVPLR
jgi:hypothetical protein